MSIARYTSDSDAAGCARGALSGHVAENPVFAGSRLRYTGSASVVITDGRRGAFVATSGKIVHCPALQTDVVGTAGAGDAFASAFVALTALGWLLPRALKGAFINSASVVRFVDTQTGLLKLTEIEEQVASDQTLNIREWPMDRG